MWSHRPRPGRDHAAGGLIAPAPLGVVSSPPRSRQRRGWSHRPPQVTIPDATVEEAVENAIFNGAALFGTNAGYPGPFDLESFFGSNETEAGAEAGRQALAALVRTGWNGVGVGAAWK